MSIDFSCLYCGHPLRVDDALAGERVQCKGCSRMVVVRSRHAEGGKTPTARHTPEPAVSEAVEAAPDAVGTLTPYGDVPIPDKPQYMGRGKNWVFVASAVLSLLAMLLPWISWGEDATPETKRGFGEYVTGFELPVLVTARIDSSIREIDAAHGQQRIDEDTRDQLRKHQKLVRAAAQSLYTIYLIPGLALLCLIEELLSARTRTDRWRWRLVNSLTPAIFTVAVLVAFALLPELPADSAETTDGEDLMGIGPGYWVTWLAALISLVSTITSPLPRQP